MRRSLIVFAAVVAALVVAAPASAFRVGHALRPVADNPADHLVDIVPDPEVYDAATHCSTKPKPGMTAFVGWLRRHADGAFWGTYRCEKWGPHEASLHAENRAVDWHLDVAKAADRHEARRLIELFLAPDEVGTQRALARRMWVEEIIWACSYWGAGMQDFIAYRPCLSKHGEVRRRVDPTIAHRNHIHLGLSKRGAMRRTSYWTHA
jgi:hypothetical protein